MRDICISKRCHLPTRSQLKYETSSQNVYRSVTPNTEKLVRDKTFKIPETEFAFIGVHQEIHGIFHQTTENVYFLTEWTLLLT